MVGEACLPSNAYYPRTPDYTLCSGVHVCWSEHSDSSFVYGFMSLDYGFGTMTATTSIPLLMNGILMKCLIWLISEDEEHVITSSKESCFIQIMFSIIKFISLIM